MAKQNIFDNETFFEGYRNLRDKEVNANNIFEIPALFSLLPDLTGKKVLDLGCGFGEHCKMFIEMGAESIVGIDISEKMLEVARKENADPKITYLNMPMEDLYKLTENDTDRFDVAVSSLALHYVDDFSGVVSEVFKLLNEGGSFIFSQEHPLNTCHGKGERWTMDENGKKLHVNLSNYCVEKEYESAWFVENVQKKHRMFSTIMNTLIENGFSIEKVVEPMPTDEIIEKYPWYDDNYHKPDFLLVKSVKK